AALFEWDERARAIVAEGVESSGLSLNEWREVPIDPESLGAKALATMPKVWHGLIAKPDLDGNEWEQRLYLARRQIERRAAGEAVHMYLPSMSSRTVVYKGLMAGSKLADFYLDLRDESCESRLAVFHQRYSTNTMPDWRPGRALPVVPAHRGTQT